MTGRELYLNSGIATRKNAANQTTDGSMDSTAHREGYAYDDVQVQEIFLFDTNASLVSWIYAMARKRIHFNHPG